MHTTVTNLRIAHGKPNQLNIYVLDRDSSITGYGAHKRCIVFGSLCGSQIEVRVDAVEGDEDLPWPTEAQVRKVASHPHDRLHGRGTKLALRQCEQWTSSMNGRVAAHVSYSFAVIQ